MTFNQLNYFITVARCKNFSHAAETLFVTQSALSRSIAALESEMGVVLFDRAYHNLHLTPAGELMLREGTRIMESLNSLVKRVQALSGSSRYRITIGIVDGQKIATGVVLAVKSVLSQISEFGVDIKRMDYESALHALKEARLDVIQTLSCSPGKEKDLEQLHLVDDSFYLVARTDDPIWRVPGELTVAAIENRDLLILDQYPGNREMLSAVAQAGVKPRVKIVGDMETFSLWLESGMGISICNGGHIACSYGVQRPLQIGLLKDLPTISVDLMWNPNNITPLLELFLSLIQVH